VPRAASLVALRSFVPSSTAIVLPV
jgi:hypothetical protein